MRFKVNPYDPYVANKIVNNKQLTVFWHVNNLKVSHKDPRVVTNFIKNLEEFYGEVRFIRGKIHNYLGITLDFLEKGRVIVKINNYKKEMINIFPEEIKKDMSSPVAEYLYMVDPNAINLNEKDKQLFHTLIARNLFF